MVEIGDQPHSPLPAKREPSLAESLSLKRWPPDIQGLILQVDRVAFGRPYSTRLAIAATTALEALGEEGEIFAFYLYGVKSKTPRAVTSLLKRLSQDLTNQDVQIVAELGSKPEDRIIEDAPVVAEEVPSSSPRSLVEALMVDSEFYMGAISSIREGQLPKHQPAVEKEKERLRGLALPENDIRLYAQWNVGMRASLGFDEAKEEVVSKHAPFQGGVLIDTPKGKKRISEKTIQLAQEAQVLLDQGLTVPKIASRLGKSHVTIYRSLEALKYLKKD